LIRFVDPIERTVSSNVASLMIWPAESFSFDIKIGFTSSTDESDMVFSVDSDMAKKVP